MRPTQFLRYPELGIQKDGRSGVQPWRQPVTYETYNSPYGPKYKISPNLYGINYRVAQRLGIMAGLFGVAGGVMGIFFLDSVPRIKEDILAKIPVVGDFFVEEVPPEDNPF